MSEDLNRNVTQMSNFSAETATGSGSGSSSSTELPSNTFYWVNNYPVSYGYFAINVGIIVVHILIAAGNGVMLEALRRTRKAAEPAGHCLMALSGCYIWLCVMMIYTGIYGLANMQNKHECLLRFGLLHSAFLMVTFSNCLLTIDRFLQIQFPFWYSEMFTTKSVWIVTLITTSGSIIFSLSPLLFGWYRPIDGRTNICEYFNILPAAYLQSQCILTICSFFIMTAAYAKLFYIAHGHRKAIRQLEACGGTSQSREAKASNAKRWRPVLIALILALVYLICWCPLGIFGLYLASDPEYPKKTTSYTTIMAVFASVPSLSGIASPMIFSIHSEVKGKFLEVLCIKQCRKSDMSYSRSPRESTTVRSEESVTSHQDRRLLSKSRSRSVLVHHVRVHPSEQP